MKIAIKARVMAYSVGFVINYCSRILAILGQILIFVMVMLITVDVVGRNTVGMTTLVAGELPGYMLVAIVFFGLAHTQRVDRHIEINLLTKRLSPRTREWLKLAVLIVFTVFACWFTWCAWGPVKMNYVVGTRSQTLIHTPMWIPRLVIPIGMGALALQLLSDVVKECKVLVKKT